MEQMPKGVEGGQMSEATLLLQRIGGEEKLPPCAPSYFHIHTACFIRQIGRAHV